jgi:alcohol dehydrogenase class IV
MSLSKLGLRPEDVDRAAALVAAAPYKNPRAATEDDVRRLLQEAL